MNTPPDNSGDRPPQQPPRVFVQQGHADGPVYDPAKGPPSYGPYSQQQGEQGPQAPQGPPRSMQGAQPPCPPPEANLDERARQLANLTLNCEQAESFLCGFIRSEIYRTGFKRAVVGLSGGVDSTIVTYLATIALGPQNVLAVTMPYKTSSEATKTHSQLVLERLGVETIEVSITAQVDAYFEKFPEASQLRRGNKCARERMSVLYDQSVAFEGLVLGTSNKSELLLGYGTQFGDLASALNPLGDIYKTQLYPLGDHLGVPPEILSKKPSGDLWVGQTDEEELGFSYDEVDHLLHLLVDCHWPLPKIFAAGYDQNLVEQVVDRISRNQFKSKLPVIAKLSQRTV